MTIRDSMYFTYAGIRSLDRGIVNISQSPGLQNEPVTGNRSLDEDRDIGGKRYLKRVDPQPLEFPIRLYFEDGFDDSKLRETARWLLRKNYQPLVFENNPNRILHAVFIGEMNLTYDAEHKGYVDLTVRCDTEHAYTPFKASEMFDLTENTSQGTLINFNNNGDMATQPIIYIEKYGDGNVTFVNTSDGGKSMTIRNLVDGEKIKIDCLNHEIETNTDFNRYNDFDFNWLKLVYGVNRIMVYGQCKFYYKCQFNIY